MKTLSEMSRGEDRRKILLPPNSLQVLCLTDADHTYRRLENCLLDTDFEFHTEVNRSTSLADTLNFFRHDRCCDIILFDSGVPHPRDPETLRHLADASGEVPVIALCENSQRDLGAEMVRHGAHDYLAISNLNADLLHRAIRHTLDRQRAREELGAMDARLRQSSCDLESAQLLLIQVEKLNSLGKLAAGVAHDVKNPLATLQLGVDYFHLNRQQDGDADSQMIQHMQEAITSANRIIRGMLDYSRSDPLELELCNINRSLRKALRMVRHEVLKLGVTVVNQCTDPLPAVNIDAGKIEQVLINILSNGMQAMAETDQDRKLQITTNWGLLSEIAPGLPISASDTLGENDHAVCVEIRDFGSGIPEDKLERVFEPFYTTKPAGQGTGLGMSVAKNIVDLHQGRFHIENAEGPGGLRVKILLKACEKPFANSAALRNPAAHSNSNRQPIPAT